MENPVFEHMFFGLKDWRGRSKSESHATAVSIGQK